MEENEFISQIPDSVSREYRELFRALSQERDALLDGNADDTVTPVVKKALRRGESICGILQWLAEVNPEGIGQIDFLSDDIPPAYRAVTDYVSSYSNLMKGRAEASEEDNDPKVAELLAFRLHGRYVKEESGKGRFRPDDYVSVYKWIREQVDSLSEGAHQAIVGNSVYSTAEDGSYTDVTPFVIRRRFFGGPQREYGNTMRYSADSGDHLLPLLKELGGERMCDTLLLPWDRLKEDARESFIKEANKTLTQFRSAGYEVRAVSAVVMNTASMTPFQRSVASVVSVPGAEGRRKVTGYLPMTIDNRNLVADTVERLNSDIGSLDIECHDMDNGSKHTIILSSPEKGYLSILNGRRVLTENEISDIVSTIESRCGHNAIICSTLAEDRYDTRNATLLKEGHVFCPKDNPDHAHDSTLLPLRDMPEEARRDYLMAALDDVHFLTDHGFVCINIMDDFIENISQIYSEVIEKVRPDESWTKKDIEREFVFRTAQFANAFGCDTFLLNRWIDSRCSNGGLKRISHYRNKYDYAAEKMAVEKCARASGRSHERDFIMEAFYSRMSKEIIETVEKRADEIASQILSRDEVRPSPERKAEGLSVPGYTERLEQRFEEGLSKLRSNADPEEKAKVLWETMNYALENLGVDEGRAAVLKDWIDRTGKRCGVDSELIQKALSSHVEKALKKGSDTVAGDGEKSAGTFMKLFDTPEKKMELVGIQMMNIFGELSEMPERDKVTSRLYPREVAPIAYLMDGSVIRGANAITAGFAMKVNEGWSHLFVTREEMKAIGVSIRKNAKPIYYASEDYKNQEYQNIYNLSDTNFKDKFPEVTEGLEEYLNTLQDEMTVPYINLPNSSLQSIINAYIDFINGKRPKFNMESIDKDPKAFLKSMKEAGSNLETHFAQNDVAFRDAEPVLVKCKEIAEAMQEARANSRYQGRKSGYKKKGRG